MIRLDLPVFLYSSMPKLLATYRLAYSQRRQIPKRQLLSLLLLAIFRAARLHFIRSVDSVFNIILRQFAVPSNGATTSNQPLWSASSATQ